MVSRRSATHGKCCLSFIFISCLLSLCPASLHGEGEGERTKCRARQRKIKRPRVIRHVSFHFWIASIFTQHAVIWYIFYPFVSLLLLIRGNIKHLQQIMPGADGLLRGWHLVPEWSQRSTCILRAFCINEIGESSINIIRVLLMKQ